MSNPQVTITLGRTVLYAKMCRNDLQLKLMRKRLSRRIQHELEECKKMELRQKMSRTIRAPKGPQWSLLRHNPQIKRAGGLLMMDPLSSYYSWTSYRLIPESLDRVLQASRRISLPRNIDKVGRVSSTRPINDSRMGRLLGIDVSLGRF